MSHPSQQHPIFCLNETMLGRVRLARRDRGAAPAIETTSEQPLDRSLYASDRYLTKRDIMSVREFVRRL
jgi:hypothetical protein